MPGFLPAARRGSFRPVKIANVCRHGTLLLALVALAIGGRTAAAQSTALVPLGDPAYQDIDRLVELGLLDSVIVGQRPYSRRELARIIVAARDRLDRGGIAAAAEEERERAGSRSLGHLERRYGDEADGQRVPYPVLSLLDGVGLIYNYTTAERRTFPAPHSRLVEALIDPLAEPRLAQPAIRGSAVALELSQLLAPTDWLALYLRERIEYRGPVDTTAGPWRGELLIGSARARFRNVALSVGRQPLAWAQHDDDGLFFASDGPGIDQVSLESDLPFRFKGPLRRLGLTRATIVLAALGPSTVRNESKLLAYKASITPASWLEVGGTFMNHFGGEGGRPASFGDRLVDLLPFVDIFRRHNYTDSTSTLDVDSDKLIGADARVRIPRLAGMTIAGEVLIDDFDVHALPRLLTSHGSQTVRVIFPVVGSPNLSLRVGAKHMGSQTYTHFALTSGIASRGRLLGDELGPDAKEFNGEARWTPSSGMLIRLEGREQVYSNATYAFTYTDPGMVSTSYTTVSRGPDERRHILVGTMLLRPDSELSLTLRVGAQAVENWAFGGTKRLDHVIGVALRLRQ